jgi:hypothetical protein
VTEDDARRLWWGGMADADKQYWLDQADDETPIGAWIAFKCAMPDALAGMTWWFLLTQAERQAWRVRARSSRPSAAWNAYKRSINPISPTLQDGGPQRLASDAARTGGTTGSRDVT